MAMASMPSRLRTRATLMPPPPGSRWAGAHRILVKGASFLTDVETSRAGLMVRVTISVIATPACAFDLRQSAQTCERGVLVENEIGGNRFEIFAEPPFFSKARTKLRANEIFRHMTQNASGNEYSAARPERERKIAGDGAEHRAKHVDGGAAGLTRPFDPGPGDLGSDALWQPQIVQGGQRFVKIFQPVARNDALGRDMSEALPQIGDDGVFPRRTAGHRRMAALARKHEVTGCAGDADRHSQARAGAERRERRACDRTRAANLAELVARKPRQGPRDGFKVVDQPHG